MTAAPGDRAPADWWEHLETDLPHPGETSDPCLGIEGEEAEPLPEGDADHDEDMS